MYNPRHNPLPRVAAIHDLSGIGHTSLCIVIPVFSAMGIQACPLPTAVLSSQTGGVDDFCFVDLTGPMRNFLDHWKRLDLKFDAVYSGFLGSPAQAEIVADCIVSCLDQDGLAVVDPVLGDNGKLDPTMTPAMVESLRWLVSKADCITPNFTEAALLLGETMPPAVMQSPDVSGSARLYADLEEVKDWLRRLAQIGPRYSVITSVPLRGRHRDGSAVLAYDSGQDRFWKVECEYIPAFYPGTGDTFTSVLTAGLLRGDSLPLAMDRAVQFVTLGIRATFGHDLPMRDGILLERVLDSLHSPLITSSYELLDNK
ncbi:MAG: pyridoxamine kinase [Deltaproteobacteria bacterium]|jgi:pyridoxine kinase|nr:pyridoxamine kinase [Deltaproteobacteria bacterium]